MDSLPHLRKELQQEYETTKKFFALFPDGKNDYAPHEKSMKLMPLATHVAEVFGWPDFMLKTDKLDFAAGDYQPTFLTTKKELQQKLEDDYANSKMALEMITEEDLNGRWTMNVGEKQLADYNKYEAITVALDQITHHRAQLGVYYRLLDIPLPGSYGPTADDESF